MATEFVIDEKQLKRLRRKLKGLDSKLFSKRALKYVAVRQKQRMILRTENGKDVNNNPFKPYNAQYALKKRKLNVNKVNLTDEAEMLNSITQNATEKEARIFFNRVVRKGVSTEEIAKFHNNLGAGRNKVVREFFGMSETDKQKIFEDYTDNIGGDLRKEGFK